MSGEVQLQADIGRLGLQGFGAFTSVLATLSADNIVPMALIQMEKLGTLLPVNGEYAERVKGLLQRCNDTRLDNFALFIGWRKNDTPSLMAGSAGGQAIALLSMCLTSLFKHADIGTILSRLCSRLCPRSANISSCAQLAEVARLLASKVDTLGFGNLLAKEITRIHDVYDALGRPLALETLLERLSVESVTDIIKKSSQALCQEDKICRISGLHGMGHVIGLIRALFPCDLVLTVEGVVVQDVEHPKIRCEINLANADRLTEIQLETSISNATSIKLPIKQLDHMPSNSVSHDAPCSFSWTGWLADYLQLTFMNYGRRCDRGVLEACCDLLVLAPASIHIGTTVPTSKHDRTNPIPSTPLLALLGPLPRARMCVICKDILNYSPTAHHMDLQTAFKKLVVRVTNASRGMTCRCTESPCDWDEGWCFENAKVLGTRENCPKFHLWRAIGDALRFGLWSFFIDAGPYITIRPQHESYLSPWYITSAIRGDSQGTLPANDILLNVFRLFDTRTWDHKNVLITSSEACTVYPTILKDLKLPSRQFVTFTVVEGQIVYEHRYHRYLCAAEAPARPRARKPSLMDVITPSHIGAHSGCPLLTIRECFDFLELKASIQYARNEVRLNLRQVILGYIGMRWTSMCTHPVTKPMNKSLYAPLATSVASPAAARRLGVAMARWNSVAQFLCCEDGYQAILQKECCLDCAAEMLDLKANGVIVVA